MNELEEYLNDQGVPEEMKGEIMDIMEYMLERRYNDGFDSGFNEGNQEAEDNTDDALEEEYNRGYEDGWNARDDEGD